jgi:hypothetical protein
VTNRLTIDQLPEGCRFRNAAVLGVTVIGSRQDPSQGQSPASGQIRCTERPARRVPNKTEARWLRDNGHGGDWRYEALSWNLSTGIRYTPDWCLFDEVGRLECCVEVKGAHRFGSHGRSRAAYLQAAKEWPGIRFEWWTWKGGAWHRRNDGGVA